MTMIKTLEIEFSLEGNSISNLRNKLPILLLNYLLQNLDENQLAQINSQPILPYSQYIIANCHEDNADNKFTWRINALNTIAVENILYPLYQNINENLNLTFAEKTLSLKLLKKNYVHNATYNQLVAKYFTASYKHKFINLQILTKTAFKDSDNNSYIALLQPKTLIIDLINKWNCFAQKDYIDTLGNNIIDDLAQQLYVETYNLNFQPHFQNKNIPTFTGNYVLGLNANIMSQKLLCILAEYAVYCGIGINNNLGMGAVKLQLCNHKKQIKIESK